MSDSKFFNFAIEHQQQHGCGAKPYLNGKELEEAIKDYKPKKILEIGTGVGYTAAVMATAAPQAEIESLEKDVEHASIAKDFLQQNNITNVEIKTIAAEDFFESAINQYDFIFFDGFQIHYQFLPEYERLLKQSGILFLANNHLQSKTSQQFFEELQNNGHWKILHKFADTTLAKKIK